VIITQASNSAEWTAFLTNNIPIAARTESGAKNQNNAVSGP
jgi:hypothetical protein